MFRFFFFLQPSSTIHDRTACIMSEGNHSRAAPTSSWASDMPKCFATSIPNIKFTCNPFTMKVKAVSWSELFHGPNALFIINVNVISTTRYRCAVKMMCPVWPRYVSRNFRVLSFIIVSILYTSSKYFI